MKISIDWLRQYVDTRFSAEEIAEKLTMSGLEVDETMRIGSDFDHVVVGSVVDVAPHPNADRLTVCRVDAGLEEPLSIVCGAPNVAAGQRVPVALVGATLSLPPRNEGEEPQAITIRRTKLRGEVSEGMICAEDELGLSDDHSGIMVLDDSASPGQLFRDYLIERGAPAADTVLDVAITPNRPDATSHFGVARDVAALSGSTFEKSVVAIPEAKPAAQELLPINIEAPEACRRYVGVVVRGVEVSESPEWLKQRLAAIGLRPRNNVVDVTNFVMHECGQPLHAFDLNALAGPAIEVRLSEGGERFRTLDGRDHELPPKTLLICDAERPVAIAGIMGGENSEVSDQTTDILIESAYFDPSTIRRAAKRLLIQTDSSYRFERGVDSDGQLWAAARAAELIVSLAGGTVALPAIDVHPNPVSVQQVRVRPDRVTSLLGVRVPVAEMTQLLERIGFVVEDEDGVLLCTVPSFRPDVEREVDVIEEIARLYGYDRIPTPKQSTIPNVVPAEDPADRLRSDVRQRLAALGYHEVHTNSMLRAETAERFNAPPLADKAGQIVETLNPISREMAALRPSLLPGLLSVVAFNQNHGQRGLRFFEFGHVFARSEDSKNIVPGYRERDQLLVMASGPLEEAGWDVAEREVDFFDLKGVFEHLAEHLGLSGIRVDAHAQPTAVTDYHARLMTGDSSLGIVGRLSSELTSGSGVDTPVYFVQLDWQNVVDAAQLDVLFQPISRFPAVDRDIAVVVDSRTTAGAMLETIRDSGGDLLRRVQLFDLYEGDRIASGKKSLAFSMQFAADRTLTDREVDERVDIISRQLKNSYGAELRQ